MREEVAHDIVERAWATFWQAALAAAPVTFVPDWDWVMQSLAVMGIAGLSGVLAMVKGMIRARGEGRSPV